MTGSSGGQQSRRGPKKRARVGHKKSRNGCQTCRKRRVKCDEGQPVCRMCRRLDLKCEYEIQDIGGGGIQSRSPSHASHEVNESAAESLRSTDSSGGEFPGFDLITEQDDTAEESAVSRSRRLMELRLLHSWMARSSQPWVSTALSQWRRLWHLEVPQLALQTGNDNLLCAVLALSATQTSGARPEDTSLANAKEEYWLRALREQRRAVAQANPDKAVVCVFAGLLVAVNTFAKLKARPLAPYSPPTQWLDIGRSVWAMMAGCHESQSQDPRMQVLMDITRPIWRDDGSSAEPLVERLYEPILKSSLMSSSSSDPADDHIATYRQVFRFIGSFRQAIDHAEPAYIQLRRICIFPHIVPPRFIELVRSNHPGALVVLAYFFVIVAQSEAMPYFGDPDGVIPRQEIKAIREALPEGWTALLTMSDEEMDTGSRPGPGSGPRLGEDNERG